MEGHHSLLQIHPHPIDYSKSPLPLTQWAQDILEMDASTFLRLWIKESNNSIQAILERDDKYHRSYISPTRGFKMGILANDKGFRCGTD